MASSLEEALEMLDSDRIAARFKAARYFITHKHPEYKGTLVEKRKVERVRHIRMALGQAITGLDIIDKTAASDYSDSDALTDEALRKYLKAQAIEEFSGTIIHELSKKIGFLEVNLTKEFDDLPGTDTEASFNSLKDVFNGIINLRLSAAAHKASDFDLAQLIQELVYLEDGAHDISFNFEGPKPCLVRSDKSILSLALSNGIRNSIEAVKQLPNYTSLNNIVICWGKSNHDVWVSIIDNGVGIHGEPKEAFKVGNTNKDGHIGFGLGILEQCMETLGGYAELSRVESGGAQLILRWNIGQ